MSMVLEEEVVVVFLACFEEAGLESFGALVEALLATSPSSSSSDSPELKGSKGAVS